MQVVGGIAYYLVSFMDEFSRYIVHHEVVSGMDGKTVSLAAQAAIDRLSEARHRRKEKNLELQQRTTPYSAEDPVASN